MPGKVEAEEDQRRPPPVAAPGVAAADAPAVAARQLAQVLVELAVEGDVVDHQVGLQVQRQAEGIEIARTDGRPVVVDHRDLAVQRTLAVFVDTHALAQQVVVEQPAAQAHQRHVRHAL